MCKSIDKNPELFNSKSVASKNSRKIYLENSYYHLYNRGVEKRKIFLEEQDYSVFLSYLKEYLLPKDETKLREQLSNPNTSYKIKEKILRQLKLNNFYECITLLAYCLMSNHLHLLVKQKDPESIDKFMNSLGVRYAVYFNRKYKRVGKLFQDVYKAVLVKTDEQLLHLSRYIHRNPLPKKSLASQDQVLRVCMKQPSSLPEYLEQKHTKWIQSTEILTYFSKTNPNLSYQNFVEQSEDFSSIQNIAVDL